MHRYGVTGLPSRQLSVYRADFFRVTHGVNEGDPLRDAEDLVSADRYALTPDSRLDRLALASDDRGGFVIGRDTGTGRPGAAIHLDSLLTFTSPDRETLEAFIFVELARDTGHVAEVYLYPLDPIRPATDYELFTITREGLAERFAATATAAFTRGTRITMADGRQVPVDVLRRGDRILTRDRGAQALRWIGVQTMRAEGALAPVVIAAGALNNACDLVVNPNHRLFVYQRVDAMGTGQSEVLVKAGLLVNGTSVTRATGGYVDYVQLLFDAHEIVYAEGIAAESLFVDTTTRPALPEGIAAQLPPEHGADTFGAVELSKTDLERRPDAVEALRRASAV